MSSSADRTFGQENTALDEIELAGELMIAATDSSAERLPTARIDEVLLRRPPGDGAATHDENAGDDRNDLPAGDDRISSAAAD